MKRPNSKKTIELLQRRDAPLATRTDLSRAAVKDMLPMQPGDVMETYADIGDLMRDVGFKPQTSIEDGIRDFVAWYRGHYNV